MSVGRILLVTIFLGVTLWASLLGTTRGAEAPRLLSPSAKHLTSEPDGSMLFGMGPAADQAIQSEYVEGTPIRILSSWFDAANREETLKYMRSWRERGLIEDWWGQGYVLHLITYEPPGSNYHVSPQFLEDVASLSEIFAGENDGSHAVLFSLATEFQTYTTPTNRYDDQTALYYEHLQRQVLDAQRIIKAKAPNARVSLSWGGWQVTWDNPDTGEGLSMIGHFGDTMRQMDFVSFQLMSELNTPNAEVMHQNLDVLGSYNPHLMVAHYKPDSESQRIFDRDLPSFFNDEFIQAAKAKGLFAFSFMDGKLLDRSAVRQNYFDGLRRYTENRD